MKTPISYHQRILNILADGQWHTLKELFFAIVRFIPNEAAEKEFLKRKSKAGDIKKPDRIARGKKRLVFLSLNSAIHHRKIVLAQGHDWDRRYRLTKEALRRRQTRGTKEDSDGRVKKTPQ